MTNYARMYRFGITPWERYGTVAAASITALLIVRPPGAPGPSAVQAGPADLKRHCPVSRCQVAARRCRGPRTRAELRMPPTGIFMFRPA